MNLDGIFEDLEAQFDGYLSANQQRGVLERSHVMRVWHHRGQISELAAPILGADFVAGMALGENIFRLIRLASVLRIGLTELPNSGVPESRYVSVSASEFLDRLTLPFSIRCQPFEDELAKSMVVLDLLGQTLVVESVKPDDFQLVPLAAIEFLEFIDVENFDRQT
jgi:hypothetical protein